MSRSRSLQCWTAVAVCALAFGPGVDATVANTPLEVTLVDNNATAVFDLTYGAGMHAWTIDDVDQLVQQWLYYQIDGSTVAPLETLGGLQYGVYDLDFSGEYETLSTIYSSNTLQVKAKYVLAGSNVGMMGSDMAESISLKNTGLAPIVVDFYQYVDLNVGGTPIDSSVFINRTPYIANQIDGGGTGASETFVVPSGDVKSYRAGLAGAVLVDVMDGGGLVSDAGPYGPGDLAWSFHWQYTLVPNAIVTIGKDKTIAPEPATLSLLILGGLAFLRRRGR